MMKQEKSNILEKVVDKRIHQSRLNRKINLAKQFEQFKNRIQTFENKNQMIINKIKQAYSFKKQTYQKIAEGTHNLKSKTIYLEDRQVDCQSISSSELTPEEQYNKVYQHMRFSGKIMPITQKMKQQQADTKSMNAQKFQYRSSQHLLPLQSNFKNSLGTGSSMQKQKSSNQKYSLKLEYENNAHTNNLQSSNHHQPYRDYYVGAYQNQYKQGDKTKGTGYFYKSIDYASLELENLQQKYKLQVSKNDQLEQQILNLNEMLKKFKANQIRLKSFKNTVKMIIQNQIQNFQDQFVQKFMVKIQKSIKACDKKIRYFLTKLKQIKQLINQNRLASIKINHRTHEDNTSLGLPSKICTLKLQHKQMEYVVVCRKMDNQNQKQMQKYYQKQINQKLSLIQRLESQIAELKFQQSKRIKIQEQKNQNLISRSKIQTFIIHSACQQKLNDLEQKLSLKSYELQQLKLQIIKENKIVIQRQCQIYALNNKIKKLQSENWIKQKKIIDFSEVIFRQNSQNFLDKSINLDNTTNIQAEVKELQDLIKKLQVDLQESQSVNYTLQKQKNLIEIQLEQAKKNINKLKKEEQSFKLRIIQLQRISQQKAEFSFQQISAHLSDKQEIIHDLQEQKNGLIVDIKDLSLKNNDYLQQYKAMREDYLKYQTQLIKLGSQLNFVKQQNQNMQVKVNQLKIQVAELKYLLEQKQKQLESERYSLKSQIEILKNDILKLPQNQINIYKEPDQHSQSFNASEVSVSVTSKHIDFINENILLKQRIKDLENLLQIKTNSQMQLQNQYKINIDRIKIELNNKKQENQKLSKDLEIKFKQLKYQQKLNNQQKDQNQKHIAEKTDIIQRFNSQIKILNDNLVQIQNQKVHLRLKMEQKQNKYNQLKKILSEKQVQLEELRQEIEMRELNFQNIKSYKQIQVKSKEISQEMENVEQYSMLSDISQVFKKDDYIQNRIKTGKASREYQIKLFQKTICYIQQLKNQIEDKVKRIKVLQNTILATKSHESKWNDQRQKSSSSQNHNHNLSETVTEYNKQQDCEEYKDYDSVQIDTRRSRQHQLIRQLQNQKNLVHQENKILLDQIQVLQEEIIKSEQQQNTLMRIKDLYKQEIKNLIQNKQAHTSELEKEITRLRQIIQESQSYHNLQAIRQLFIKIVQIIGFIEDQNQKNSKKQQKRKELEECIKVMCSILKFENNLKDRLIVSIRSS